MRRDRVLYSHRLVLVLVGSPLERVSPHYLPAAFGLAEAHPATTIDGGYFPFIHTDAALYTPRSTIRFLLQPIS